MLALVMLLSFCTLFIALVASSVFYQLFLPTPVPDEDDTSPLLSDLPTPSPDDITTDSGSSSSAVAPVHMYDSYLRTDINSTGNHIHMDNDYFFKNSLSTSNKGSSNKINSKINKNDTTSNNRDDHFGVTIADDKDMSEND